MSDTDFATLYNLVFTGDPSWKEAVNDAWSCLTGLQQLLIIATV